MHAVVITDGALRIEERPDPEPGDTEVVVSVRAAGLNGADMAQLAGHYPPPPGARVPADIPGLEIAGEVVATGPRVTRATTGERVMGLVPGAGQATMAAVEESHLLSVPSGVSWAEAGGFPEVFFTAYDALFTNCRLTVGDRLLVTGAAGGVGVAGVQLGAAAGATVVASVRDPDRRGEVTALGAHVVIGTEPEEIAANGPYDVVLELVGQASLPAALRALAIGARAWVIGTGSGGRFELDLSTLMVRRATIGGSTLRSRTRAEKAAVAAAVAGHVLPLLVAGSIRVPVCATFPLEDASAAYDRFSKGSKLGKVVLLAGSA